MALRKCSSSLGALFSAETNTGFLHSRPASSSATSSLLLSFSLSSSSSLLSSSAAPSSFACSLAAASARLATTTLSGAPCTLISQRRHLSSSPLSSNYSTSMPDFTDYKKKSSPTTDRNFAYFMVGTTGFLGAVAAKNTVHDFLSNLSASADVLALAKVEVDIATIPEGKNVVVKWRGKPIFIRHRTQEEIDEANKVDISSLRHQETDAERTKKPEWLVMLGVCTHLGCVPIGEAGDFGGWYCPCHGSHYDISGRIRMGPAPLNLEIPEYQFTEGDQKIVIG